MGFLFLEKTALVLLAGAFGRIADSENAHSTYSKSRFYSRHTVKEMNKGISLGQELVRVKA